ncbi:MAG: hypothetical protein ACTINL_04500 [Serratia proteamaculans]|uniref:hypothetical protein n=1 Tax=Serratia proteamaculans TaxID=28151 RepID=UPI00217A0FAF|nr:hypothetical protein [Serratia proteamaculans]CAI1170809.1 Uncharacterised protein [Serratia proteamaculans]
MAKVKGYLDQVAKQLQSMELKVGFMADATYPDGTSVAMVAAQNEYGGLVYQPARTQTLEFKQNKVGEVGNRFVKKGKGNFVQDVVIPARAFYIPPRPFFRNAIAKNGDAWKSALVKGLRAGKPTDVVLDVLGAKIQGDVIESIGTLVDPPISEQTKRRRRTRKERRNTSDKPLVDTKVMINSVTYRVDDNESS